MVPTAYLKHQMPGRVRLAIPSRRGDRRYFESLVKTLSTHPAVRELKSNPLTGGVVIAHSGRLEPIVSLAAQDGVFELRSSEVAPARSEKQLARRRPGQHRPLDANSIANGVAIALAGLGAMQAARGYLAGSATENLWNAYGAQRVLGNRPLAAGLAAVGLFQLLRGRVLAPASSLFFYALSARHSLAREGRGGKSEPV